MPDLSLEWGADLTVGPTGDLALVDGANAVRQRIVRRLHTAAGDYLDQVTYGAGLGQRIGSPTTERTIAALVRAQMAAEAAVAASPEPSVSVAQSEADPTAFIITITYWLSDDPSAPQTAVVRVGD
ncbi:conserved protein of unknown function (plasmid) [Rhodovastum atsumiense]|uniref:Phage tail protein n=1 Tax=Rhodovastum atsumiense TaxID=504468 RepID=A0A5M6IUC2_9PROT|nr:hypothetical protein [Rhodovastum atsumiense]KAA5611884.1 hypothetical protein F1189_12695 [Rhodovastum atsumiense]CAH2606137.1 conserved protein of unknown function [Rhodovastum atsumiense]